MEGTRVWGRVFGCAVAGVVAAYLFLVATGAAIEPSILVVSSAIAGIAARYWYGGRASRQGASRGGTTDGENSHDSLLRDRWKEDLDLDPSHARGHLISSPDWGGLVRDNPPIGSDSGERD